MIVQIVGKKSVEFMSKTDNKKISYAELYCLTDDKYVVGKKSMIVRTSIDKAESIVVPGDYQLDYQPRNDLSAQLVGIYKLEK